MTAIAERDGAQCEHGAEVEGREPERYSVGWQPLGDRRGEQAVDHEQGSTANERAVDHNSWHRAEPPRAA
jgi:hypothetical protein